MTVTVFLARRIHTMDPAHPHAEAVAVRDGRIIGLDLSADWCMSPPEFRGNLLYVTCSDNGLMTLRIDPAVYPPR